MTTHFVTGATGFLGRHLIERLVELGDVVALVRSFDERLDKQGVKQIEGDLSDTDVLREAVAGAEYVYHLAGRVTRDPENAHTMYELHVDGTRRLLDALVDTDVKKIVVASTSGTVGVSTDPDFIANDTDPTVDSVVGHWPYYLSKIYAERVCDRYIREFASPIVQLRPTLLLGPGDDRLSSTGDVAKFLDGKIPTIPTGGLSFVDARDVADAFVVAATEAQPGDKFLLGAANMTIETFFDELAELSGRAAPKFQVPHSAAVFGARLADSAMKMFNKRAAVDPVSVEMAGHYWYIDWSRAEQLIGFAPRDPRLTLRDTIRYIERQKPSKTRPQPTLDSQPERT